ncbi:putative Threonylcarbamoyl-AMP synthase [Paratrimastix pyriformis]|uniref:Threonylcarbamoyl-AMP synthase n=1 Tax=Paratrimastix pyriformis TaxID=342808 RepID=A0ABQ8UN34_9EUKA|nr:putative Threonylcarbamoyl-AMP synthase [Paratrimastix pyriformis]
MTEHQQLQTRLLNFDRPEDVKQAVDWIRQGQVVAFPTETVYGLGADAFNAEAVLKVFHAKGRPADNPLIVHLSSMDQLPWVVDPKCIDTDAYRRSIEVGRIFWPGPLSILFPKLSKIPDVVTAGLSTVVVRIPSNPIAQKLIAASGTPIAAPSANISGRPSPTCVAHVMRDLGGRIPGIVEGGCASVGVESTVVDLFRDPPAILRPGGVTLEQLLPHVPNLTVFGKHPRPAPPVPSTPVATSPRAHPEAAVPSTQPASASAASAPAQGAAPEGHLPTLGELLTAQRGGALLAPGETPPTPGMKYQHYCPEAAVVTFDAAAPPESEPAQCAALRAAIEGALRMRFGAGPAPASLPAQAQQLIMRADRVGVMLTRNALAAYPADLRQHPSIFFVQTGPGLAEVQRSLFQALRAFDSESQVQCILAEAVPEVAEGLAIMNRLRKATSVLVGLPDPAAAAAPL